MMHAAIVGGKVIKIFDCTDENEIRENLNAYDNFINVSSMIPMPLVGWSFSGSVFTAPTFTDEVERENYLAELKVGAGTIIARIAVIEMGAQNKILNKSGSQVAQILNSLASVKMLLETGALGTARSIISSLIAPFPDYVDIFNKAIDAINKFESEHGL